MTDEEIANDIYDICLKKKSIYCNRKMGEETCDKCKTYQMYKLGLEECRKELEKENAELKAHCKAVDEVNEKMKCCANCKNLNECYIAEHGDGLCFDACSICNKWECKE